jgi:hypothetical protein
MVEHALAFVNYKYLKTSKENRKKYSKAYWYVSKKPRIANLVGDGGTLWVVTSRRPPKEEKGDRIYSLAYKLVDCQTFEVWDHLKKDFGEYGVIGDYRTSQHFPSNNMTNVLLSLEFSPKKPIRGPKVIGLSMLNARCLSVNDIKVLEEYADKVLHGKNIFISYSTKDMFFADTFQDEMEARGFSVDRDVRSIVGGEQWEPAIFKALKNADVFVVLISENSAKSEWVRREVRNALDIVDKPAKLKLLLPLVLSMDEWKDFPEIHRFQRREWEKPPTQKFFDQLADELKRWM